MELAALKSAQGESEADPGNASVKEDIKQLEASSSKLDNAARQSEADLNLQGVVDEYLSMRTVQKPEAPLDDKWWATIITAVTVVMLVVGRYGLIQSFSTAMVGAFTLVTIVNLLMLQSSPAWGVSLENIIEGIRFRLPVASPGSGNNPIATALGAFGVGAW